MALFDPTPLELRFRPSQWIVTVVHSTLAADKAKRFPDFGVNMFGIVGPVSCNVQRAAGCQPIGAKLEKRLLHYAALVVAFLRPWVWKVQIDALQSRGRDLRLENFDRVVRNQFQVLDASLARGDQTMSNPGLMDLNSEEVLVAGFGRLLYECCTIAEAYFEHDVCIAAKDFAEFKQCLIKRNAIGGPQNIQCPLL